jgi:ABC-type lipoprotein export system ATPase subunit
MTAFIKCRQVSKSYWIGSEQTVALSGVNLEMETGEMIAIVGHSGAGKSSLLNLLGGLDTPTAGDIIVDGQNLRDLKPRQIARYRLMKTGFLWQQTGRNLLSHRSALHNITLPMMLANVSPRRGARRAQELLDAVGLGDQAHKRPEQLSGGEQQRVALAVALANTPPLLLADEPTGSLDRQSAVQVMTYLTELRQEYNLTVLLVTHDPEIAAFADRVLTLRDGVLGQNILLLSDEERLRLPETVRRQLALADQVIVEIRPEGVLLRPELEDSDTGTGPPGDVPEPDKPPRRRRLWRRR